VRRRGPAYEWCNRRADRASPRRSTWRLQRWSIFGTVSSAPSAECATERGQYRDLVQLVCVRVGAARAAAERGRAPPGRAERGRLTSIEPDSAVSCRSDRQSRLPRAVMTLTAVASGGAKMERSALIFDTGVGCRRNRDGVPYAVPAVDRPWSCAARWGGRHLGRGVVSIGPRRPRVGALRLAVALSGRCRGRPATRLCRR
jgi:hypothetical protein